MVLEQEIYKYFVLEVFKYLRLSEEIAGLRYKLRSAEYLGEGGVGSPLKILIDILYNISSYYIIIFKKSVSKAQGRTRALGD